MSRLRAARGLEPAPQGEILSLRPGRRLVHPGLLERPALSTVPSLEGLLGDLGRQRPKLPAGGEPLLGVRPAVSRGAASPGRSSCPSPLPLCLLGVTCPGLTRQPF